MKTTFKLYLAVEDVGALYQAACERLLQEDADVGFYPTNKEQHLAAFLGTPEQPDVRACLAAMLDPGQLAGCEIFDCEIDMAEENEEGADE